MDRLDIAPNYAGVIMAIANGTFKNSFRLDFFYSFLYLQGTGSISGIVGPWIVGLLTPNSYLTEWRIVFWISFALFVGTTIVYDMFASGEIQDWNDPHKIERQNVKSNGISSAKLNEVDRTI